MPHIIDLFLHLDKHLLELVQEYGTASYIILFIIVFCETGLVVTPFLPGDSLLFAAGALASAGSLSFTTIFITLFIAAVLGDSVNYQIGRYLGPRAFDPKFERFLKKEYLIKTEKFFAKHGGKAIVIARFVPILRTFVPFMAGVGTMSYAYFITYNLVGAFVWVGSMTTAGYMFGEIPIVKNNFSLVVIGIVILSITPGIIELIKARKEQSAS